MILKSEPVRSAVYSVVVAALALGVALGYIDDGQSGTIAGIVALVLGTVTEVARSRVTPIAKMVREERLD